MIELDKLDTLDFVHNYESYRDDGATMVHYLFLKPVHVTLSYNELRIGAEAKIIAITVEETWGYYELLLEGEDEEDYDYVQIVIDKPSNITVRINDPPHTKTKEELEYEKLLWLRDNIEYVYNYEQLKEMYNQIRDDISK